MGLALCKRIVESAGGRIWYEANEDGGTTFFVSLPLADEEDRRDASEEGL